MEHESSAPCSQGYAIGPYPEPDASSLHLTQPTSLRSIQISSHLRLDLQSGVWLFLLGPSGWRWKQQGSFKMSVFCHLAKRRQNLEDRDLKWRLSVLILLKHGDR